MAESALCVLHVVPKFVSVQVAPSPAAKTHRLPPASLRGVVPSVVVHVISSALCALQEVPIGLVSVQVGDVAAAKMQVAPVSSVRALVIHVAESALCALHVVPPFGSVHVVAIFKLT